MALKVSKAEVWAVTIDDRPGGAAEKLEGLSKAGANLEMLLARRSEPGKGVMFVTPVKGKKAVEAAQQAGMGRPENIHSVRIEGGDKPGLGSRIARTLSDAGINFRGMSAIAMSRKESSPRTARQATEGLLVPRSNLFRWEDADLYLRWWLSGVVCAPIEGAVVHEYHVRNGSVSNCGLTRRRREAWLSRQAELLGASERRAA